MVRIHRRMQQHGYRKGSVVLSGLISLFIAGLSGYSVTQSPNISFTAIDTQICFIGLGSPRDFVLFSKIA
jgi:hypothetical protein